MMKIGEESLDNMVEVQERSRNSELVSFLPLCITHEVGASGPEIELLGKTAGGRVITCMVEGFYPYMYAGLTAESDIRFIQDIDGVVQVEICAGLQSIYGYSAKAAQPIAKITYNDPKRSQHIKTAVEEGLVKGSKSKPTMYEVNINYVTRFMVDTGMVGMGWVSVVGTPVNEMGMMKARAGDIKPESDNITLPPLSILSFDIECAGRAGKFPAAQTDPVVQIGCVVSVLPVDIPKLRILFCTRPTADLAEAEVRSFATEQEMLVAWADWLQELDPDVLTGYNTTGFDFPYLLDRAKALGLKEFAGLGRKRAPAILRTITSTTASFGTRETQVVSVPGRLVFDVMDAVRKEMRLHSYSLNTVAYHVLGEQKEDVHHTEILGLFNGTPESRKRLGVYCMRDAELPMKILFRKNLFLNYCELARVTGVPFEYLVARGQGIRVLAQLLRASRARNFVLPVLEGEGEAYEGGHVMEPSRGFYTDAVVILDFASLYPSIIMAYNLCYSTLVSSKETDPSEATLHKSPTGDCFVQASVRPGVLPGILASLLERRKQAKRELAAAKDPAIRAALDARQLALKIAANSVYGFTGAAKTGLPCIPVSRSVTSFGREILMETRAMIEAGVGSTESMAAEHGQPDKHSADGPSINQNSSANIKAAANPTATTAGASKPGQAEKLRVIYGDTDSVMVTAPHLSLEEAFAAGKRISQAVSERLRNPLTLEFEKVYKPFLLLNKKRYAGCIFKSPSKRAGIDTKGIETVRRDTCGLVRELLQECLDNIFIHGNVEGAKKAVRHTVESLMAGQVGLERLIISKSISRKEEGYAVHLAHVELAERMRKRDPGSAPGVGDRVSYVVVKGKGPVHARAEDPIRVLEDEIPVDTEYYLEQQISKPVTRLLEHVVGDVAQLLKSSAVARTGNASIAAPKSGLRMFVKPKAVCFVCRAGAAPVCKGCVGAVPKLCLAALEKLRVLQYRYHLLLGECQRMQHTTHIPILCCNRDCPIFYKRRELTRAIGRAQAEYNKIASFTNPK
ncbi:DNA polymerase delta subunit 1 [Nematocida homosporus]|uniref:DNA polymerase delta subunit 1 n=1 Tax=Nematocida homosporus TaxID=1912981 RepID=UPI002220699B|nr:DNA polymerase delta subunit 1 [Nematocida homosporus]KAI5187133.1 DNA polymerase delta subunit 1 [Nematocida homosporus]